MKTPFAKLYRPLQYGSWERAKVEGIHLLRRELERKGMPGDLGPVVIGITGVSTGKNEGKKELWGRAGKTARGVLEVLKVMGSTELSSRDVQEARKIGGVPDGVYHMGFDRTETRDRFTFEEKVAEMSALLNCATWLPWEPAIVTRKFARKLMEKGGGRLRVIGDIACDAGGSLEFCQPTDFSEPVYVYNPLKDQCSLEQWQSADEWERRNFFETGPCLRGLAGEGIVVMAVDSLPTAFPREASEEFSSYLMSEENFPTDSGYPLPMQLAILGGGSAADHEGSIEYKISRPLRRATILLEGRLTPDYQYLREFI